MFDKGSYNVSVNNERQWLPEVLPEQDMWENHGFVVRGRTADGEDLTLFVCLYVVKRGGDGEDSYYAIHGNVSQTMLIHGKYSTAEKQQMHNNDFVASGWAPVEHLPFGSIETDESDERVLWKVGNRVYEDAPPRWAIRGEHAGVDLDIEMEAHVPAFWLYPFDRVKEDGIGWYEAYLKARGTIRHDGRELKFEGYACHERIRITREHVPERLKGQGLQWHHLFHDRVQCWMMASPSIGDAFAYLTVDGETFEVKDPARVQFEELEHWIDPKSWFQHPYRWHVTVESEGGVLDLVAGAYERGYYVWPPFKATTNILTWMTADAMGTFTKPDGTVIKFFEAPYMAHSNRAFFNTFQPGSTQ